MRINKDSFFINISPYLRNHILHLVMNDYLASTCKLLINILQTCVFLLEFYRNPFIAVLTSFKKSILFVL